MTSPTTQEGFGLSDARYGEIERQVRERYPNWNSNRMTMDYQEADDYFMHLLQGGDSSSFKGWSDGDLPGVGEGKKMAMPALPTGWENLGAQQKIDWFNQNSVAPDQLLAAGVSQGDIDWMKSQGYTGMPQATTGELPPGATYLADGTQLPSGWDSFGAQEKINCLTLAYLRATSTG